METAARRRDPRTATFRAANQRRVAEAKVLSAANIQRALGRLHRAGVTLPPKPADAARLRMARPDAPLSSLAASASEPCTKDTLAGRLRRVIAAAAKIPARRAGECSRPAASPGHDTWDPWRQLEQIHRGGPAAIIGTPGRGMSHRAAR